jgi:hypothetical protein
MRQTDVKKCVALTLNLVMYSYCHAWIVQIISCSMMSRQYSIYVLLMRADFCR